MTCFQTSPPQVPDGSHWAGDQRSGGVWVQLWCWLSRSSRGVQWGAADICPLRRNSRHLLIWCHWGTGRRQISLNTAQPGTNPVLRASCLHLAISGQWYCRSLTSAFFFQDSSRKISVTITPKVSVLQAAKSQCLRKLSPS